MDGKETIEPTDVNKAPAVIKDAQTELGHLDILVCGECHDVFHYIEAFQQHRSSEKCSKTSKVREKSKYEFKPEIWAFMLWKHGQFKKISKDGDLPSSWIMYQHWCKLNNEEKKAWMVAGQNIQSFTRTSTAIIQENKPKIQTSIRKAIKNLSASKNSLDDEPLEEGEIRMPHLSNARVAFKAKAVTNKINLDDNSQDSGDSEMDIEEDEIEKPSIKVKKGADLGKRPVNKQAQLINDSFSNNKKASLPRAALRTSKGDSVQDAIVEKILNKRINQKKKCTEYLIKWENMSESENTWEPKIHLIRCKKMLDDFDKIKPNSKVSANTSECKVDKMDVDQNSMGRPQRTSKQKALNQVKEWCGDMADGDEESVKRKSFSDDEDSSDSFEKKMKFEEYSDTSDEEKPAITIRRVGRPPGSLNGVAKKNSDSSIPSSQRVVRVNQKQLPSLSSGVYIMSKTEGIIKLDSNSSQSVGGPLFKIGPKIGQTHVKMVKKDQDSTSKIVPKPLAKLQKTLSPSPKPIIPRKPLASPLPKTYSKAIDTPVIEKTIKPKIDDDDESDGLEELEFPTDLPLPAPDSPPGEFTLCPLTGKLLGQDYDDKNNENEEPEAALDNIVKIAAAELPDVVVDNISKFPEVKIEDCSEDLTEEIIPTVSLASPVETIIKTDVLTAIPSTTESSIQPVITTTMTDLEVDIKPNAIEKNSNNITEIKHPLTKPTTTTTATSILNSALTNTKATSNSNKMGMPKKLLSTPSTVRQKVSPIHQPSIHKPSPTTTIIHKISPGRPKSVISKNFNEPTPVLKRSPNVTTYKPANVARRIGNTTIYKTEKPAQSVSKPPSTSYSNRTITPTKPHTSTSSTISPQTSIRSTSPSTSHKPSTSGIINMPLLTTEEEPSTSAETATQLSEIETLPVLTTTSDLSDLATFSLPDSETPLLITGDDGTIYQVAGQNEDGQTILISEGPDGQQQCVIVSSEGSGEDASSVITNEPEESNETTVLNTLSETDGTDAEESQVVAQIIKADPPSPGGTRKVVLMLPDGNLMMTDVTAEQYAALELDK